MLEQNTNHIAEEQLSEALLSTAPERAIIVGVDIPGNDWPVEELLDELAHSRAPLASPALIASSNACPKRTPARCSAPAKFKKSPNWRVTTTATP